MAVRPDGAALEFSDPACVREVYVEEIGAIEITGGMIKVVLVSTRDMGYGPERHVVCRLVAPLTSVPSGIKQVIAAVLGHPFMSTISPDTVPH